ncbi:hypothetical protein [Paraliomyxa miuraensis]|uniref:hypothetical protein n=1 Tax=Paraliomyxa miuraensis TaxID=376150 RepID=UPI00224DAED9|nr:hypothetical protein [Paraliomyxa miuraensis]MCX4239815.1 hypothetical protein [Paraliomyxa miuraensis]
MRRHALAIAPALTAALLVTLGSACQKQATGPTLSPAVTDTVQDQGATFKVEVSWQNKAADEVEVVVEMTATGIEQTDNLVVDVKTGGFVITEGVPDWTGFVLPREHYTHRVSYKMLDDQDQGRMTVSIRRTLDSSMLWGTELLFQREGGQVRLVP